MAFSAASGAIIKFGVEGGADARREIGSIASALNSLSSGAANIVRGISIAAFAHQLVSSQRELDKLSASLTTATGSTQAAAQAFRALEAFSASTPYGLAEVTEAFIKMRNLGLDPSEAALRSYGNTASAMGKGLNQMIEAVADAATGEFERLKEFGIKAKQNGDQVSFTFQGVTTTIANNAAEIERYLQNIGNVEFGGAMEARAQTLDGAISNLGDAWDSTMRTINSSGIGDETHSMVLAMIGALNDFNAILNVAAASASAEGEAVQETAVLHQALTMVFETIAVLGVNVAYVLKTLGMELGGLAAQATAVVQGDFTRAKLIGQQMRADAEQARKDVDAKSKAILEASTIARKAAQDESAAKKAAGRDDLAQYKVVQSAAEKAAEARRKQTEQAEKNAGKHAAVLKKEAALVAELAGLSSGFAEDWDALSAAYKRGTITLDQLTEAQAKLLARQPAIAAAQREEEEAAASVRKAVEGLNNERSVAYIRAVEEAEANEALVATYGLSRAAIEQLDLARMEARLSQRASLELDEQEIAQLERMIEVRRRNVAALANLDALDASRTANQEMTRDWERTVEQYGDVFRRGFADMLNNGRDGWKSFTQSLKSTFKTTVADQIYKMFAEPLVMRVVAQVSGYSGGLGAAGSDTGSTGPSSMLDNAMSLFSAGKTMYSGFASGLAGSMGGVVTSFGNAFGSSAVAAFGKGMTMTPAAVSSLSIGPGATATAGSTSAMAAGAKMTSVLSVAGWIAAGMAAADRLYQSGYNPNNGSTNTALTNPLVPGAMHNNKIFQALGMNERMANMFSGASVVTALFGRKSPQITEQGLQGTLSDSGFTGRAYADILEKGGVFRSNKRYTKDAAVSAEMDASLDSAFGAMLVAVKGFGQVMGLETAAIDGYTKSIKLALTDDEAKNQEAIAKLFGSIGDELAARLVPSIEQFHKVGETASATLQRIATNYTAVDTVLQAVGKQFGAVGLESVSARERLLELSGGLEAFGQSTAFFQQNFLTEAQRLEPVAKQVTSALAEMNLAWVDTREEFRDVVLGLDLTTQQGAQTYASLMKVQGGFAQLHPAIETVAEAAAAAAQAVTDQRTALQEQLDDLVLTPEQKMSRQRDAVDPSNRDLFDQIQQVSAAKARRLFEDRLFELTASDSEKLTRARQREREATDALLRPTLELIYAQEDFAASAQKVKEQLQTGARTAFDVLSAAVNREKESSRTALSARLVGIEAEKANARSSSDVSRLIYESIARGQGDVVDRLSRLSDALGSTLVSMRQEETRQQDRRSAQLQISQAVNAARSGHALPEAESINEALRTVSQRDTSTFGSYFDFARDFYTTAGEIAEMKELAAKQLTPAEQALEFAKQQIEAINANAAATASRFDHQIEEARSQHEQEMARYDQTLGMAQQQLNAMIGTQVAVMNLNSAMANFSSSLAALRASAAPSVMSAPGYANPSVIGQQQSTAQLAQAMQSVAKELAAIKHATTRTAESSTQMAQHIDQVSMGGQAFLTEAMPA